jgi:hypothetical protein
MADRSAIEWTETLTARFWSYVDRSDPDGCWPWTAGRFPGGYGQFRAGTRKVKAHRVAYELTHGPLGDGMKTLHKCDHPPCCRPDHLFEGTPGDNARDRNAKGRAAPLTIPPKPGEANPSAKLTWPTVRAIRARRQAGATLGAIATEFGISQSQVRNIVDGRCWKESA